MRRYEAAAWLRKMVGVVGARDLPAEPSEEEFRLGLRSGLILCNVLNKIQPGAVPKVQTSFVLFYNLLDQKCNKIIDDINWMQSLFRLLRAYVILLK